MITIDDSKWTKLIKNSNELLNTPMLRDPAFQRHRRAEELRGRRNPQAAPARLYLDGRRADRARGPHHEDCNSGNHGEESR